jgi:hypothetical protein
MAHLAVQDGQLAGGPLGVAVFEPGQAVGKLGKRQVVRIADLRECRFDPATALEVERIIRGVIHASMPCGIMGAPAAANAGDLHSAGRGGIGF